MDFIAFFKCPLCFLTLQELIGALLACAFFCLFPVSDRGAKDLPVINFDHLFAYVISLSLTSKLFLTITPRSGRNGLC